MTSAATQPNYFLEGPVSFHGVEKPALGLSAVSQLPIAEQFCCLHLNSLLALLQQPTLDRFRLVVVNDPVPDATCFSRSKDDLGEIRLTTGLLSLVCILAARCAVIMDRSGYLVPWMPFLARPQAPTQTLPAPIEFGAFTLSDGKQAATSLTSRSIEELQTLIQSDTHIFRSTIMLASAAMEFFALHEMGHFDAMHDEVKRLQRVTDLSAIGQWGGPLHNSISVQRVYEHLADIFAVRLMVALGIMRPIGEHGARTPTESKSRTGLKILAYLGASLALSAVTLLRSKEPQSREVIELIRSIKGEHPLPTTRLLLANEQIQLELQDAVGRNALWPGSTKMEAITLEGMVPNTMFLALTTLSDNWLSAVNRFDPGKPTDPNISYWLKDDEDLNVSLNHLTPENVALAMNLMKLAGSG